MTEPKEKQYCCSKDIQCGGFKPIHKLLKYNKKWTTQQYRDFKFDLREEFLADINSLNILKWTPLSLAVANGYRTMVYEILKYKDICNIYIDAGWLGLIISAIKYQSVDYISEMIIILLYYGANINKCEINGITLLMGAAIYCKDVDASGDVDTTAKTNNQNIIKLLLNNYANINQQDIYGMTAIMLAVQANNLFACQQLLDEKTINLKICNKDGETALFLAIKNKLYNNKIGLGFDVSANDRIIDLLINRTTDLINIDLIIIGNNTTSVTPYPLNSHSSYTEYNYKTKTYTISKLLDFTVKYYNKIIETNQIINKLKKQINDLQYLPPDVGGGDYLAAASNFK